MVALTLIYRSVSRNLLLLAMGPWLEWAITQTVGYWSAALLL